MVEINPSFGSTPAVQLFRLVLTLATHLRTLMDQRLAALGLTVRQAAILTFVESSPVPPMLGEIAAALATSHQNTRQIVSALERKGFVEVRVDPEDHRARRVEATPLVADEFSRRDADDHAAVANWMGALTEEEQVHAVLLLNRVFTGLRKAGPQNAD